MRRNDPQDLRLTAVRLFIALLDQGDAVGIVNFATTSEIRAHLTRIGSKRDKEKLMAALDGIHADGWTDIQAAFRDALTILQEDRSAHQRVIIILTDGKPELAGGLPPGYEQETLNLVKRTGAQVLAIGLTREGITPFLGQVVSVGAQGSALIPANTATDLLDAYLDILGKLKDRIVIGEGIIGAPGSLDFTIDPNLAPYIDRISFIAAMHETAHVRFFTPDRSELLPTAPGLAESFTDPRFAVLTWPSPAAGIWSAQFEGRGLGQARAILRSRLRVRILQPQYIHPAGKPMPIVLSLIQEDPGKPPIKSIGDATFSALIEGPDNQRDSIDQFYDDGTHGDAKAHDGDFTFNYVNTDIPGTYLITINGRKGVVPVSTHTRVEIVDFPQIVIDSPVQPGLEFRGPISITAHLVGGDPPVLDQGSLVALITKPDGTNEPPLSLTQIGDRFTVSYLPPLNGLYVVKIALHDATYRGIPYKDEATVTFQAKLMPTITISTEKIDLGQLESLKDGQTVLVKINSTSTQVESLNVSLVGVEGGSVTPAQVSLDPKADTTVTLRITSSNDLLPGKYEGAYLIFTTQGDATLVHAQLPVIFEIVASFIQIEPTEINLGDLDGIGLDTIIPLHVVSRDPRNDTLQIASIDPPDVQARIDPQVITANQTTDIKLHLSALRRWEQGDHRIVITFDKPRAQVAIQPDRITIHFRVPSLFERISIPLVGMLGWLLVGAVVLWWIIPAPTGQLVGKQAPVGQPQTYIIPKYVTLRRSALSAMMRGRRLNVLVGLALGTAVTVGVTLWQGKPGVGLIIGLIVGLAIGGSVILVGFIGAVKTVTLGSAMDNDIQLNQVADYHAQFFAQRRPIAQKVGSGARQRTLLVRRTVTVLSSKAGRCTVNGTVLPATGRVLERGDEVRFGDYVFEYR